MLGSRLGAGVLVDRDDIDVGGRITFDGHDRQPGRQARECLGQRIEWRDDDDSFDPLVDQAANGLANRGSIGGPQARNSHEVLRLECRLFDAVERRRRAVQSAVEGDDAQGLRFPGDERPGCAVAAVAQLLDGGQYSCTGCRCDARVLVDDTRHCLMRDSSQLRDVGHRGRAQTAA